MVHRKAQAALEFLTTYGWAFLVILIMMGAISYFGFLNPGSFLPKRCVISSEFACIDYRVLDTGIIDLKLKQNFGHAIEAGNITCTIEGTTMEVSDTSHDDEEWGNRQTKEFTCDFSIYGPDVFLTGQNTKIILVATYNIEPGGYIHATDGDIYAEVIAAP